MIEPEFDRKKHWEDVYSNRKVHETSWHQKLPEISLSMIEDAGIDRNAALLDVGGGASLLVDHLLECGYRDLTVLDISAAALEQARKRLGNKATLVDWVESDITRFNLRKTFDLWHDRAAFHFLTAAQDRRRYVRALNRALKRGGQAIIAAFALDGPEKCSGLDIVRYNAKKMDKELGPEMQLLDKMREIHITPLKREQRFEFYRFRKIG